MASVSGNGEPESAARWLTKCRPFSVNGFQFIPELTFTALNRDSLACGIRRLICPRFVAAHQPELSRPGFSMCFDAPGWYAQGSEKTECWIIQHMTVEDCRPTVTVCTLRSI